MCTAVIGKSAFDIEGASGTSTACALEVVVHLLVLAAAKDDSRSLRRFRRERLTCTRAGYTARVDGGCGCDAVRPFTLLGR